MKFDFIILSTQRSGTHMLQSALNQHPEITCHGEILHKSKEWIDSDKKVKGCIQMKNRLNEINYKFDKVIYLRRNENELAKSRVANRFHKKASNQKVIEKHNAHRPKTPCTFIMDRVTINNEIREIRKAVKTINKFINDKKHIVIDYENPDYKRIQRFLGVKELTIKPTLKKVPHTYYVA